MESDMPPTARGTPSQRAGGHRNVGTPDVYIKDTCDRKRL